MATTTLVKESNSILCIRPRCLVLTQLFGVFMAHCCIRTKKSAIYSYALTLINVP